MKIMNKEDYDNLINRIRNLVSLYEKNVLHYNQYQFYLANGERLNFEIFPQSIAHLFGIHLDNVKALGLFRNVDSYLLLKEFLEKSFLVYRQIEEGRLYTTYLFSDYITQKLDVFEKIIYYYQPSEIEFVCKYDKRKTFQEGLGKNYPCDYFIAKREWTGDLFLLGLVRNGNQYSPMSSLYFPKGEKQTFYLRKLLTNQILTFPSTISIHNPMTNYSNDFYLPLAGKSENLRRLKNYSKSVQGVAIDVSSDYQYVTNGYVSKESKLNTYRMMCQQFMQAIVEHKSVLLEEMSETLIKETDMLQLIRTYNDEIIQKEDGNQIPYSELLAQYKELENQVFGLQQQLEATRQEACANLERMQMLEKENEDYKEFQEDVVSAIQRQKARTISEVPKIINETE